jgi:hypothetical protein
MKVEVQDELIVTGGKDDKEDGAVRLDVKTASGEKCEFSINITFVFFPDQANYPRKQWKSYENFLGKRLKVQERKPILYYSPKAKPIFSTVASEAGTSGSLNTFSTLP